MVQLVVFINLFFIPALPLYIIYKKKQKPLKSNLNLVFQYCIVAACNIPLTKIFTFLAKKVGRVFISIDSGYYTLAALFSAVLIYVLYMYQESKLSGKHWAVLGELRSKAYTCCNKHYVYYKTYLKKKYWTEKIAQRGAKRILGELLPAYLLIFASCFMMLIFEPILLYTTNMNDFWFDFKIMIWPVLGVFAWFLLIGILIVSAIYFVNLVFSGRTVFYKLFSIAGFIAFFLLYLQGNWLAGNLPPLTGAEIVWENYGEFENSVLGTALILLSIGAVICIWKFRLNRTIRYGSTGAVIITVMLIVSLIPTVIENDGFKSKDTFSATTENFNTVSRNRNFLILLVDTVDSKAFYDVMTQDEDFDGILNDFTYYPDALSTCPFTRDSIPVILTGMVNHNEEAFEDYSSSAYNQSPLLEKLEQNGYGINIYAPYVVWNGQRKFNIENSISIYDIKVDFTDFMNQELKYIRYKYCPYKLKKYSQIETLDFNTCRIFDSEQNGYSWFARDVYNYIRETNILDQTNENFFQFVHSEGAHPPFDLDKNFDGVEGGTYDQKIAASLTMIKAYLQRIKDNGVYDNSVIVIMADHGYQTDEGAEQPYSHLDRCNPVLFIKGINEKHKMRESDQPISYLDLQDAFCDLIDGKQSTELFTEFQPGRNRTALWYLWEVYDMVEYETTGKAWEIEKFTPTGNVYDLKK